MTVLVEYVEVVVMVVEVDMLLVGMALAVDIVLGGMALVVDIALGGMVVAAVCMPAAVDMVIELVAAAAMVATTTMLLVVDMPEMVVTVMELPVAVMLATSTVFLVVDMEAVEASVPLAILVEALVDTVLRTPMVQATTTVELLVAEALVNMVAVSVMEVSVLLLVPTTTITTFLGLRLVVATLLEM
jgi:hypothetical protein